MSDFLTSSIPAYKDISDLVVPLVKSMSGSTVEHIFMVLSPENTLTIALLIPILHKQWQSHCQLYTLILLTTLHDNADHMYHTLSTNRTKENRA